MAVKTVDATVSGFNDVFEKFRGEASQHKANLILFLADNDPSTSLSWCPDCVRAEPVIYKKLEEWGEDVALLRAYVGDRPTWRNPQHPWRVDSRFQLKGVPTLVRWENDAVAARLEDHEAHIESKIHSLLVTEFGVQAAQQEFAYIDGINKITKKEIEEILARVAEGGERYRFQRH